MLRSDTYFIGIWLPPSGRGSSGNRQIILVKSLKMFDCLITSAPYRNCSNFKNKIRYQVELLREMGVCVGVLSFPSCVRACNPDPMYIREWDQSQTEVALYLTLYRRN
jgi:hypothetical protein